MNSKPGICIITYPRPQASIVPLTNLVRILSELSGYFYIITGNEAKQVIDDKKNIHGCSFDYKVNRFFLLRIFAHIILQLNICFKILQINRKTDIYLFFMGEGLILPMLTCKLLRKPVVLALAGSLSKITADDRDFLTKLYVLMEESNYWLADGIIVYSKNLIEQWGLQIFSSKVHIAHEHIIDFNRFKINKVPPAELVIGYVGRFSSEKGIMNFVQAISLVYRVRPDIHFLIAGDGPLKPALEKFLLDQGLSSAVKLTGWICHDNLPEHFRKLNLFVLPSYTEGLPNIMLEAMACGIPVLANCVGTIPDIIKDGKTGFLMEDNSPECIFKNIMRVVSNTDVHRIALNGYMIVRNEFTFETAKDTYKNVLDAIMKS